MNKTPKIIIDYNLDDLIDAENLFRHLKNIQQYYKNHVDIEVMAYGPGIALLILSSENKTKEISSLQDKGIIFIACQNTMKSKNISSDDLISNVVEQGSGLGHIIDRQEEGWAYLKA